MFSNLKELKYSDQPNYDMLLAFLRQPVEKVL
jgi:hypothetical protein